MANVYEAVRNAILTGELEEGRTLSQVALARRLGVSRTPLREALATLQAEGLVDATANGRVRVSRTTMENLEATYAMRIALEAVAIKVGVRRFSDDEIAGLERLLVDLRRAEVDPGSWSQLHRDLHRRLVSKVEYRFSLRIHHLQDGTERYRQLYLGTEPTGYRLAATEHAAIVAACARRDEDSARVELARHLARTALSVIAIEDPLYEPEVLRAAVAMVMQSAGVRGPIGLSRGGQTRAHEPARGRGSMTHHNGESEEGHEVLVADER